MDTPVILITGAGKGIGEAVVREIILRKAELKSPRLLLTSRTETDLLALQQLCKAASLECEILAIDLVEAPDTGVKLAIERFGALNMVIHSAGVGRFGNFLDLTKDDLAFVSKTNIEASFLLMQAAYRQMQKQKSGDIVFITSIAAEMPFEHSAIYCMSKYAQRGLLEVMRLYGRKDGIRIIDVKPGAVFTPMWGEVTSEMRGGMMEASDIAKPIINALLLPARASVEEITIRPLRGDI